MSGKSSAGGAGGGGGGETGSKLSRIQAQFQQKQMQAKEVKLLQMLDNQQQRALQKAQEGLDKFTSNNNNNSQVPPGRVRQMFEERRKGGGNVNGSSTPPSRNGGIIGIDKSYPLEPLTVSKSRTSSSKSDYEPPKRTTPIPPALRPSNLGSSNKPLPPPPPKKEIMSRSVGSAPRNVNSRVSPVSRGRTPSPLTDYPPVVPSTTKYMDYASELERQEANLASKLKGMEVSAGSSRSNPPVSSPVGIRSPTRASPTSPPKTPLTSSNKLKTGGKASPSPAKVKPPRGAPPPGLDECKMCGRYFAPDRIAKHESICKKVKVKKRKVFDPTKMRMQGTEAEPYIRIVSAKINKPRAVAAASAASASTTDGRKKVDWRKKHEEFINTIRLAKEYQAHVAKGGDPNDLPPPPPSDNSDYIQCPHCNRKFSQGAAERHIPKCNSIKSNKR